MMEKPLAVSVAHARAHRARRPRRRHPRHRELRDDLVSAAMRRIWTLRQGASAARARSAKMVAMDGHEGPKEISVQPEFFAWLTDPVQERRRRALRLRLLRREPDDVADGRPAAARRDGGDAADQARDLSAGRRRGHDRAGVPGGAGHHPGVVELAVRPQGPRGLRRRPATRSRRSAAARSVSAAGGRRKRRRRELPEPPPPRSATRSRIWRRSSEARKPEGLSSLANNLVVTEILEAARESARSGKIVRLDGR